MLAAPAVAHATYAGRNGLISFDEGQDSCDRLIAGPRAADCAPFLVSSGTRLITPDGSHRQKLRTVGAGVFSPGGRYLGAYEGGLAVVRLSDLSIRKVTRRRGARFGSWSPDARTIAYADAIGVRRVDRNGSHDRLLAKDGDDPQWSPRGRQIAFRWCGSRAPDCGIALVDATGRRQPSQIVTGGFDAEWSPGGRKLVFVHGTGADDTVATVDLHGRVHDLAAGTNPQWSPDGQWIAYQSVPSPGASLSVVRPDGTAAHAVAENVSEFTWSPDSRYLATDTDALTTIRIVPLAGGRARTVTRVAQGTSDDELCCPTWQQLPR